MSDEEIDELKKKYGLFTTQDCEAHKPKPSNPPAPHSPVRSGEWKHVQEVHEPSRKDVKVRLATEPINKHKFDIGDEDDEFPRREIQQHKVKPLYDDDVMLKQHKVKDVYDDEHDIQKSKSHDAPRDNMSYFDKFLKIVMPI